MNTTLKHPKAWTAAAAVGGLFATAGAGWAGYALPTHVEKRNVYQAEYDPQNNTCD